MISKFHIFYRRVINDVAIWIYGGVTKLMEEEVQPLLVPAIIEHEGIGCITGGNGLDNFLILA